MESREREHDRHEEDGAPDAGGNPGGGNLDRLRDMANRLRRQGQAAIHRSLSPNSSQFLANNQQTGGQ